MLSKKQNPDQAVLFGEELPPAPGAARGFAGHCDLDRLYISLLEVGAKQPTASVLYRIASGLDLSFEEFARRIERRYRLVMRTKGRAGRR